MSFNHSSQLFASNWNPNVEKSLLLSTEEKDLQSNSRRTRRSNDSQSIASAELSRSSKGSARESRKRDSRQTPRMTKKLKESFDSPSTLDRSDASVDFEGRSMFASPITPVHEQPKPETFLLPKRLILEETLYSNCTSLAQIFDTSMRALQPGYNMAEPALMPNSQFEDRLQRIYSFVMNSIKSSGQHGGTPNDPPAIYVCGVPGIGKTSGVHWCCEKAIEECNGSGFGVSALCKINSGILMTASDALTELFSEMGKALGIANPTRTLVERRLKQGKKGQGSVLILVVDEIDILLSDGNSGRKSKRSEDLLHEIMRMANDVNYRLVLIGMANASGEGKYKRMQRGGKVCAHLLTEFEHHVNI
jgi:hypothetical protein